MLPRCGTLLTYGSAEVTRMFLSPETGKIGGLSLCKYTPDLTFRDFDRGADVEMDTTFLEVSFVAFSVAEIITSSPRSVLINVAIEGYLCKSILPKLYNVEKRMISIGES